MHLLNDGNQNMELSKFPLIKRVVLYPSLYCNLRCKHCYVAGSFPNMHTDNLNIIQLGRIASSFKKPIDISGGEPFALDCILELLINIKDSGGELGSIFTNGTLLLQNKDIVFTILDLFGPVQWFVSLDGDKKAHEYLRGEGSFTRAVDGADFLVSLGQSVNINTMLHVKTEEKSLSKLQKLVTEHGYSRWRIDSPFNYGSWKKNKKNSEIPLSRQIELYESILRQWMLEGMQNDLELGHIMKYIDGVVYFLNKFHLNDPICTCRTFPIWPNGDVSWCQDLSDEEYIVGNLLKESPEEVYRSYSTYKVRTIEEVANTNQQCCNCGLLRWCGMGCRIGAIGNGQSFNSPDPSACKLYCQRLYLPIVKLFEESLLK